MPPALHRLRGGLLALCLTALPSLQGQAAQAIRASITIEPESRYARLTYQVPETAPDEVYFKLRYQRGDGRWQPARIVPRLSHAATRLMPSAIKEGWQKGEQVERQAAGEERVYYWTPYGDLPATEEGTYTLHGELYDGKEGELGAFEINVTLANGDVDAISDFAPFIGERSNVQITPDQRTNAGRPAALIWSARQEVDPQEAIVLGPKKAGYYAIYLSAESQGWIGINGGPMRRLRPESLAGETSLGTHFLKPDSLRLLPLPSGTGAVPLHLEGLRFVPVDKPEPSSPEAEAQKLVVGYFEPYSWTFWRLIRSDADFRDVVTIYKEAGISMLDTQFGRFGSRMVYETEAFREERFHAAETQGDQGGKSGARSRSLKAWSLLKNSKPLAALRQAASEAGVNLHANFGATNAYPGLAALQSEFSKQNPTLHRKSGNFLALGEPKVQAYMLGIYRETLEMGAPGISIDFCRYPFGADNDQQITDFLRRLRALADEFTPRRTILIRFPATGDRRSPQYRYETWIKENLVDYLCPSNIFSTVLHFDVTPYVAAAEGSDCKVLPVIDMIPAGAFRFVEPILLRAHEIYQAGADGIYLYQPDAHLFYYSPLTRAISLLRSPEAIRKELEAIESRRLTASKSLLIEPLSHQFLGGYRTNNERVRFWLEGKLGPELEILEGNEEVDRCYGYPYVFGDEATDAPPPVSYGKHRLKARARDGSRGFEETFEVTIVAPQVWD